MKRTRSVLVTGASTGIGYATAVALDARGWTVFAGVRGDADEAVLRLALSSRSEPLRLDVTNPVAIASAALRIGDATDGRLDGLVNNAGVVAIAPFERLAGATWRDVYAVNLFGAVDVTRAMLPLLRAARGRVVNVGSIQASVPQPLSTAYASSKAALKVVADLLGGELRPFGIRVAFVEPGAIKTPLYAKLRDVALRRDGDLSPAVEAGYRSATELAWRVAERLGRRAPGPAATVARIVHALESPRPRPRYVAGLDARLQELGHRVVPASIRLALVGFALGRVFAASRVTGSRSEEAPPQP